MNDADKKKEREERKKAKREERRRRKEQKQKARIDGGKITWHDVGKFFYVIWKIIYAVLKFVFAPFWYTGLLVVYVYRFLKERGDHALTEDDKKFLSIIPTMFFMLSLSITIIFVLVYFNVFSSIWNWIVSTGFWVAIGKLFYYIGVGIWVAIYAIFVLGFWNGLVKPLSSVLQGHDWIAVTILLIALIILTGLGIILFHATFMQKFVSKVRNFFKHIGEIPKKIALFFVNIHLKIRMFVLNYIVGKKYVETKSKNFFWATVFTEMVIALLFTVGMFVLAIVYKVTGHWTGEDTLRFGVYVSLIEFAFIGIFSTWFFIRVLGASIQGSDRYSIKT